MKEYSWKCPVCNKLILVRLEDYIPQEGIEKSMSLDELVDYINRIAKHLSTHILGE